MNLSSLNVDVLLYLLKFVDEVDCFNLALSGILKGFENFDKGINLPIRVRIYRTGKYRTGKYKTELENVNKGINLQNRYSEHFTCDVSGNQIVTCPESQIVKHNWDYVVMACAS